MARRPTINDVARQAGVSVATVDRVLNNRRPVRVDTARRVVAAAEATGYHAAGLLRRRAEDFAPAKSLGFLLQKESKPFYRQLATALEAATRAHGAIRGEPVIRFVDELSPSAIVDALGRLGHEVDAACIVSIDHPLVADEIARQAEAGIPVLSLLSRLPDTSTAAHIGIEGRRAGRTAAWALARCAAGPGPLGVLIGSNRYVSHEDREIGFRTYFREHFPDFRILESIVYLDDSAVSYGATRDLLARNEDLVGLYLIGGGVDGALRALTEDGPQRHLAFVCHELTPRSRQGLIDGMVDMVIASPTERLAERAVDRLVGAILKPDGPVEDAIVPFEIYISETV